MKRCLRDSLTFGIIAIGLFTLLLLFFGHGIVVIAVVGPLALFNRPGQLVSNQRTEGRVGPEPRRRTMYERRH